MRPDHRGRFAWKFDGSALAVRAPGVPTRSAMALGIVMNTCGPMVLIVLDVGVELGVLSPTLFTLLVIMAVVTTVATTPVLDRPRERPPPRNTPSEIRICDHWIDRETSCCSRNAHVRSP
jgi:Kef-type K+ transport system membrane component KefB